jgi:hypothetical protein
MLVRPAEYVGQRRLAFALRFRFRALLGAALVVFGYVQADTL